MSNHVRRAIPLLLLVASLSARSLAHACVMCGSSFGENDPTTNAFASSVLFLIAAPYTVFFTAAACVYFLYRRGAAGRRARIIPLMRLGRLRSASAHRPKEVTP